MSDFLEVLDEVQRENGSLEKPRGSSFMQVLNEIQNSRSDLYQPLPQETQPQNETELHRALRELGTPDWLNDYVLEPYIRHSGNLVSGMGDTFVRGWLNVPALAMRGLGLASEGLLGGQSMFTSGANWLNDVDADYTKLSEAYRQGLTGNNPTFWDNVVHGTGTSLGYMLYGMGTGGLANTLGANSLTSNIIRFLTQNVSEAMTEAGNIASELYAQDKTRGNDAFWAGMYSFGPNAGIDFLQGIGEGHLETYLDNHFFPGTNGFWWQLAREFGKNLIREETNELLQEPRQQAIETAVKNTFNSGDMSLGNLLGNFGQEARRMLPYKDEQDNLHYGYFADVFPETAASTFLTSLITAPFGGAGGNNQTQINQHNDEIARKLTDRRDELQREVNDAYLRNHNDKAIDPSILEKEAELKSINDVLAEYASYANRYDLGINGGQEVQDDAGFDLFADTRGDVQTMTVPTIDTQQEAPAMMNVPLTDTQQVQNFMPNSSTVGAEEGAKTYRDIHPDEQQLTIPDYAPMSPEQIENNPIAAFLGNLTETNTQAVNNQQAVQEDYVDEDNNDISSTLPRQEIQQNNQASWLNIFPEGNIARVRTIKGTEADVRYRIVDADSLIASTNDTGAPNNNYPQELQPRQRNREASHEQIIKMSGNLDPELLAKNRLASNGAPIIGNDGIVESGNGRIMAIRRAYRYGTGENYRNWLMNNSGRFGINPDTISEIRNPVLVRERITDVDRVKFTREANESSTSQMSMTEHAVNDAQSITPEMLTLFDPEKTLQANHDFISAFSSIVPQSEHGDFYQQNGKISKSGLDRIQNALMAKAYNDTGILNRLNEIFDDDIKNVSNALLQAAPKLAVFENGGYSPEISIRDDIVQAVHTLAQLRQEGSSVEDFMSQIQMFGDISDEAKTLLQFFDRNKRSAKRIAKGLIHYADSAMNEAKQGQGLIFADSARDKSAILEEAIRIAEAKDADTYNQLATNSLFGKAKSWVTGLLGKDNTNINPETGIGASTAADPEHHISTMLYKDSNGKTRTLSIRSGEFNDNYQNEKKYFGRYLEFSDENGNIVARFSPYTKKLQISDNVQNTDSIKNAIVQEFTRNGRNHLQSFGYFDATGKLISDGNEDFRHKHRTRQNTTPKGKNTHPDNSDTRQRKKRKDSRSLWQRFNDSRKEKAKYEPVRQKVQQTIHEQLEKVAQAQEYEGRLEAKRTAENEGTPYSGSLELTETDKARIHDNTRIYAEQYSHVITARLNAAAHLAGMSVDDYHKLWNLRIQADINENSNKRGNVEFKYNENLHRAETIIHLTKSANTSTVLHEFAHIFLKDFQDLVASVDELPEKVRKDWLYLTQWLGISDIDPKSTKSTRSSEENNRWQNAQEKFAVAFEQYYMTGKAPKSRLKRVFQYFKQWLSHVYGAVRNIRYQGSDGYTHEVELSPQVKAIFNRMLKDVPYVSSSESRRARLERAGNNQHDEGFYNQTASSNSQTIATNENGENEQSKLRLNLPFNPNELRTEQGNSINEAKSSELLVTPDGSAALGYINADIAEAAGVQEGEIQANVGVLRHAEKQHGEQIKKAGYENAQTFLLDVLHNWQDIREGSNNSLWLVAPKDDGHGAVAAVRLHQGNNGVYRVTTLIFARNKSINNKELLFTGRPSPASSSGSGMNLTRAASDLSGRSAAKGGLSHEQSFNVQSVQSGTPSVNGSNTGTISIGRSNDTFVSPSDIERFDQLALHGSGYTISNNKFGLEFIGSGEGHQSFGYGIYFAQNTEVAEHYRRTGLDNSHATFTFKFAKGQPISLSISELQNQSNNLTQKFDLPEGVTLEGLFDALKELYYDYYDNQNGWDFKKAKRRVLKELQTALSSKYSFTSVTAISNTISALKSMKKLDISGIQHGNIYFADIPESNVLLDWDAEKQNEHVQKPIQKVISKLYDIGAANADIEAFANSHTGKDFYYNLRDVLEPFIKDNTLPFQFHGKNITRSDMAASLLLNQAGIPGLTYFDGWSRYDKQGTHNFVIWNTDMIKLLGLSNDSDNDAKQYFRDTARSKGNRSSENYDQIIGIGGARRLDEAENTTLRMDNLKLARRMERQGLTPKKLWLATGWMKGKEGKWRYELPDGKLLNKNLRELHKLYGWLLDVQKKSNEMSSYTLSPSEKRQYNRIENYDSSLHTLFDAPELFEAYPDLRNIKVYFDDLGEDTSAVYNSVSDNIILNHSIQSAQEIRKSIIHELQHAIQMREGFAAGSNISLDDDSQFNKARNELERIIGSLDKPSADKVRDVLNEKFFGSSIRAFFKAASLSDNEYNVYDEAKLPASVMKQRRDYIFKEYERHAGETEARNTETRSDWSDTKRRSTPLDASEDISRDEQIIGRLPHRSSYSKGFMTQDDKEAVDYFRNSILQKLTGNPSETYNQIIGRHGAEDIDKKNGNNWLIDNLKMAQSLTERGFKPKTIRRATGWELGNDNEWKYELQDGTINVPELWDAFQNNNETLPFSVTLKKLYNNSELFDAYPELKNLPVEFTLDLPQGVLGLYSHDYFDNTKRFIQLNPMKHIGELQSTLIHEIQHAVQFIEGFAEGGEGKDILIQGNVAMSIAEKQKDALLAIASDNIKKAVSLYNSGMQRKADRLVQSLSQKEKIKWERIKPILDSIHNGQFRLYNFIQLLRRRN